MNMDMKAWLNTMKAGLAKKQTCLPGWMRGRQAWAMMGFVALALLAVGFAFARQVEHRKRLATEQELSQTIQAKQLVEAKLSAEEQRSHKLSGALELKTKEVDQVVRRLGEEARTVELLQARLSHMESQIGELQAELVLAARAREELAQRIPAQVASRSAELEKIQVVLRPLGGRETAEGRIIQVNPEWQFVVVDLGWHAVNIGDVLGVYRGEQLIAKVKVERIQEQVAAASILPEHRTAEIAVHDRVAVL